MPPKKKPATGVLGRSIIRNRFGRNRPTENDTRLVRQLPYHTSLTAQHTTDYDDTPKWVQLQSITQENDLDAFLRTAELAGTEFTAERLNVTVITASSSNNPFILSAEKEKEMLQKMRQNQDKLNVPRRYVYRSTRVIDA